MNGKLVSVIIPTYNRARFIIQAVESVLSQTYSPIEIIVVDDGSSDPTAEILAPYQDRIRYICQSNQGAAVARNTAIALCNGDYVAFLDSDDVWLPDKLTIQMKVLDSHPEVGLIASQAMLMDQDGVLISDTPLYSDQQEGIVSLGRILVSSPLTTSSIVVRREDLPYPLPFTPGLRFGEDWELCLRVAIRHTVWYVNKTLIKARRHEDNVTNPWADQHRVNQCLENRLQVIEGVFRLLSASPGSLGTPRAAVEAIEYANAAIASYLNREYETAASHLATAVRLDRDTWVQGGKLVEQLVARACLIAQTQSDREAWCFLESFFSHLPPEISDPERLHRIVFAHTHIAMAFMDYKQRKFDEVVRHVTHGIRYNPDWLRNRGVLSILARSLLPALSHRP